MERRLAAILAADVVGYSRLIGANEAGTLAALKVHRKELVDGKIAGHQGRIVKLTGGNRGRPACANPSVGSSSLLSEHSGRAVAIERDHRVAV